jgi:hypothetical protein
MIKPLNKKLVKKIADFLPDGKRKKFLAGVDLLNQCIEAEEWIPHASRKVESAFYQGLARSPFKSDYSAKDRKAQEEAWQLSHCISFGGGFSGKNLDTAIKTFYEYCERWPSYTAHGKPKPSFPVPEDIVRAWVELANQKTDAVMFLNLSRPKVKITDIGLSPKVTKTLKEMELDIDIRTIKSAIKYRYVHAVDEKTGEKLHRMNGEPLMVLEAYVEFSNGAVHNATRFQNPGCCEACGKPIPSRFFAPVEAKDRKSGKQIAMWIGTDCAKNIFGVKDLGVKK